MRIIFTVQGEGRGHMTQAISMANILTEAGHDVVCVMIGKSPARKIPQFFYQKINAPIVEFESPNFLPTANNKQANISRSVLYNLVHMHKYIASCRKIYKTVEEYNADLVINFYELLTGFTFGLIPQRARMVSIAHQYLFLHPDFKLPNENRLELFGLKLFTRLTSLGAYKRLALSFREMESSQKDGIYVIPPLLRNELFNLKSSQGNYIHGYMANSGFAEDIKEWHKHNSDVKMEMFWDKKGADAIVTPEPNLTFHQLNDTQFLQYMANAKAYITTAGFESVCEAAYLGKPVIMIPMHIEQMCNAADAELSGIGITNEDYNPNGIDALLKRYTPDPQFKDWAMSAKEHIVAHINAIPVNYDVQFRIFGRYYSIPLLK